MRNKGFTLIELIVVIAIISILAGLVIFRIIRVNEEAKISKMKSDIDEIANGFYLAKTKTGKTLTELSGNTCSDCECRGKTRAELSALPDTDECIIDIKNAFNNIKQNSGYGIMGDDIRDPWGAPYLLDENEGIVPNDCDSDVIRAIDTNGNTYYQKYVEHITSKCLNN